MKLDQSIASATTATKVANGTDEFNPTHDVIALVAYRFWIDRKRPIGSPDDDWFRAECQIRHDRTPGSVV